MLRRILSIVGLLALTLGFFPAATPVSPVMAQSTNPTSVTIAGSLQSELGCGGDWDPACAATHLLLDTADDVWQGTWTVPAGSWEYKAALNDSWDENYGAHAAQNGANIGLSLTTSTSVKFYYDHKTHWITDNFNSSIATVPGSFQSELGCPGDWQPDCLRSWLQDPDGDGVYTFETTGLPGGTYEAKAAINESWSENYGQGGVPGGANIPFTVPFDNALVKFSYTASSHVLTILAGHAPDNNVEWFGLRHDSRDPLYRTPGGAVPAGTPVKIRFRTFHNDVTGVALRAYSLSDGQELVPMQVAASDVSCYEAGLEGDTCDFWEATLPNASEDNLWYRFIVTDGTDTDYYADNTSALDGGLGTTSDDPVDNSYALMIYDPTFSTPDWAKSAVIYQIFPDRFRNGNPPNDPKTGMVRYDDPAIAMDWWDLPEGYCRNYADGNTNCPWRFDDTPPADSPNKEQPRGRDYFGGDLKGVFQKLDYLKELGVTTIYFNPIFTAKSNHRYDTADYTQVDPNLGTFKDFEKLVDGARKLGIRVVLDGVFNHMSSDSPFFDRYGHYTQVGACESVDSPWRSWFIFHDVAEGTGVCVDSMGRPNSATYDGWFGFDSIPVIQKSNAEVQSYFLTAPDSISRLWLERGASGWRMDVMGDASFPNGYWETFRQVVKEEDPNAVIIGELWQKDSTLLRFLRGDRADTTMNYRLRDAILGLLTPGPFDSKGFADSGRIISPSEFAARIQSIREDTPDAAYYSMMNLVDSHDTERLLWTLTPGAETRAEKEFNTANVDAGKQRLRLATLIQFTMPGAPTVYYGDEVGMTGDDDPDDRRTFPWDDDGRPGIIDYAMLAHYKALTQARSSTAALVGGDLRVLMANDDQGTLAYGRKTEQGAALVVINRSDTEQTIQVPVGGYLPDGLSLQSVYAVGSAAGLPASIMNGTVNVTLSPLSGVLLSTGTVNLTPPPAPSNLTVMEGQGQVSLFWNVASGAVGYNVYRSPVSGGGYVKVNAAPVSSTSFTDSGLRNGMIYYYTVRALNSLGLESEPSNEASAMPHLTIGWANLQWPPTLDHTISVVNRTGNVYGQVWIDGVTNLPGATPSLRAQLGYGPSDSDPVNNQSWTWIDAGFNVDAGNNDEFVASMLPEAVGTYDYAYRYSTTNGRDWVYADLDGIGNGYSSAQAGKMTVNSSGDTTAPAVPTGLNVVSASPGGIQLIWDAVTGDDSLYGYEILRSDTSGGEYVQIARVTAAEYTDSNVLQGATYYYVVRSVDMSFNRSGYSGEVSATAELRTVTVVFNVTVPDTTDSTGRSVYIAGFLDRLDGNLPQWDPAGVAMTRVDATHWTITLSGKEDVQIEYKYTLGSWDYVEKDNTCGEIANRQLTLSYGANGQQTVNDTVPNWRNVAPCGN